MTTIPVAFEDLRVGDTVRAYLRYFGADEFEHIYEGPVTKSGISNILLFANSVLRDTNPYVKFISATREVKVPTEEYILVHEVMFFGYPQKITPPIFMEKDPDDCYFSEDYEYPPSEISKWEPITRGEVQTG